MASMLFCDTRNRGLCETRMCRAMLIGSLPFFLFGCFAFQTRSKIENLVGEFASGMTNILGKFVQGWTGLSAGESDEVGRHFYNVAGAGPSRLVCVCGRYEYSSSDEPDDTQ